MSAPVRLHCEMAGSGPDLVLLHPVGLDHTFWGTLVARLSLTHRVLGVDLRGHGSSPSASEGTGLEDYVADIHDAISRNCSGPVAVLGLSFGGMLTQLVALTYPRDVAALVLCGCGGGAAPDVRPALRERGLAAERGGMTAVVEPMIERWFTPSFRSHSSVDAVRARLLQNDPANWSAAWHAIATFSALEQLGAIKAPTLVLAGECDAATPAAASRTLSAAIPGSKLTFLAGAPHMMQIECPDAFSAVVDAFLKER